MDSLRGNIPLHAHMLARDQQELSTHASMHPCNQHPADKLYIYIYIIAHMLARDLQEQQSTHACMHPCKSHSAYILCIMYTMYI